MKQIEQHARLGWQGQPYYWVTSSEAGNSQSPLGMWSCSHNVLRFWTSCSKCRRVGCLRLSGARDTKCYFIESTEGCRPTQEMHGRGSMTRTADFTHLPVVPFQVAAQLYQLAGDNSKAAELYLKAGYVDEASAIMGREQHPELLLPLAQALEGALPLQSLNTSKRVYDW